MKSKKNEIKKIAIVCRTVGLEYDDRIRKECISLSKIADVKIFVTFENNSEEEGITSYGIPYKSFELKTRNKLKSGKFLLIKALDFYLRVKRYLKDYDLVWAHEEYSFLFPLLMKNNKVIWDLHEIPKFFDKTLLKPVFHYIEKRSRNIIHANSFRIDYQIERGLIKRPEKHKFIRNFPDFNFINSDLTPDFYDDFIKWLNGEQYVYLQGISTPGRLPYNSLAAILDSCDLKIVVVGNFNDKTVRKRLEKEFGNKFKEKVYFTGMIEQLSTPVLIKNAKFSMVFYRTTTPNNRYCEANRFYQSLVLGTPVITGDNEPLKEIVEQLNCGISLESDGSNIDEIKTAIEKLLSDYDTYRQNTENGRNKLIWNDRFLNNLF